MPTSRHNSFKQRLQAWLTEKMQHITEDDIKQVLGQQDRIKNTAKNNSQLERFFSDVVLLISLVRDYYRGHYRQVPYRSIAAVVAGLLYVLNPVDLIPDFIPIIGYLDDAMVIAICLKLVESDLASYQAWKRHQKPSTSAPASTTYTSPKHTDNATDQSA